jgi:hypothetical protein
MLEGRMLIVFGCVAALASGAFAQGKADKKGKGAPADPMMAAMAKYGTPGPQHKTLRSMVGSWNVAGKFWMDPTKPPVESTSTAEIKPLGDLWVIEDVKGDFMGKPFMGHGVHGYDLTKNKFVGSWVDNMGAWIMSSEGTADASGKVITSMGNDFDPMTGKTGTIKGVTKIDSDTKHTMSMFKTGPDGKEMKIMELVYTKKP